MESTHIELSKTRWTEAADQKEGRGAQTNGQGSRDKAPEVPLQDKTTGTSKRAGFDREKACGQGQAGEGQEW